MKLLNSNRLGHSASGADLGLHGGFCLVPNSRMVTVKTLMTSKLKPSEMSPEVRSMIDLRHQAEQRGYYEPLGRLLSLQTEHGTILWPVERGEGVGPDLARACKPYRNLEDREPEPQMFECDLALIVLGEWLGLPDLRQNSSVPCSRCRHACDICDGSGKKQCEGLDCGGRGWIEGKWLDCPGPGCKQESGTYKADCLTCSNSTIRGLVKEHVVCPMCCGSKLMTCSRCKGTAKFSTGRINGSSDWQLPACKFCAGTGWKGKFVKQDVRKFVNAELETLSGLKKLKPDNSKEPKVFRFRYKTLVLGPIHSFTVSSFGEKRFRTFEVSPDSKGDLLVLLVPATGRTKPQKAYLVGGVVRERSAVNGSAA